LSTGLKFGFCSVIIDAPVRGVLGKTLMGGLKTVKDGGECGRLSQDEAVRSQKPPVVADQPFGSEIPAITAGWPEEAGHGCVHLDPAAVLRAGPRSFALRVRGQSMIKADIFDGDIVVGEFTPEARSGAIVVALIDGESTLKRLVVQRGQAQLVSENPCYPSPVPLAEVVIQGLVHTVVRCVR
jgi:SOS-response transcriptional repressor LexA